MQHSLWGHAPSPPQGLCTGGTPTRRCFPSSTWLVPPLSLGLCSNVTLSARLPRHPLQKCSPHAAESPFLLCFLRSTYHHLLAHCQSLPPEHGLHHNRSLCVSCSHCLGTKEPGSHRNCWQMNEYLNMLFPPSSLETTEQKQRSYEKEMRATGKPPHLYLCRGLPPRPTPFRSTLPFLSLPFHISWPWLTSVD